MILEQVFRTVELESTCNVCSKDTLNVWRIKISWWLPFSNRMWINNYSQEPAKRTSLRWHHYSGLPWNNGRIKWVLRPGTIMCTFVCSVGDKTKQQGIWKASSVSWSLPIPSAQRAAISSYSLTDNDQGFFHLAPMGSCFFSPPSALSLCTKANLGGGIPSSDRPFKEPQWTDKHHQWGW